MEVMEVFFDTNAAKESPITVGCCFEEDWEVDDVDDEEQEEEDGIPQAVEMVDTLRELPPLADAPGWMDWLRAKDWEGTDGGRDAVFLIGMA